jgi:hypothetical protein
MRVLARLVVLFTAVGCAPVPIVIYDERGNRTSPMTELPEFVEEGCNLVGIECVVERDTTSYGVVVMSLVNDLGGDKEARTLMRNALCRRVMNVEVDGNFDAEKVAHELGHMFGLGGPEGHVDDPENIMHPVPGRELTDDQQDTIIAHADRFGACAEG